MVDDEFAGVDQADDRAEGRAFEAGCGDDGADGGCAVESGDDRADIGAAPNVGRPRWIQLSKAIENSAARSAAIKAAKDSAVQRLDSDARFARVLQAVTESAPQPDTLVWQRGAASAKIAISKKAVSIVAPTDEPGFGEYVVDRLDVLHDEFCEQRKREAAAQGS